MVITGQRLGYVDYILVTFCPILLGQLQSGQKLQCSWATLGNFKIKVNET